MRTLARHLAGICLALSIPLISASVSAHETVSYDTEIQPLLERSCAGAGCHIGEAASGVDLSTYDSTLASVGELYGAPIIVGGDPDASPLIDKIQNAVPQFGDPMPGAPEALSDLEIGLVRQWVRDGMIESHPNQRGDVDGDDTRNLTDAILILNYLFVGGDAPACFPQADLDVNGRLQVTDAVLLLDFLFRGGDTPSALSEEEEDSCRDATELTFDNIFEMVFTRSCASSSCHSEQSHRADLDLSTPDRAYEALVGVEPFNISARGNGMLRVDAGVPDNSFLLRKLIAPGPGEGNRMPATSPDPLSDDTIQAIREWVAFGAPREGTIPGVPEITDEPLPPSDRVPQPPVPENGIQIHLEPFQIAPRSEREIYSIASRPFRDHPTANVDVKRIDIHMIDSSHHFILYEWIGGAEPALGLRGSESIIDVLSSRKLVVASQQAFFTITFPEGVGFRFSRSTTFDLNSHFVNLNGGEVLLGEVYINFYFAEPGELQRPVKQIFDINTSIRVPPNQTRTTTLDFPSFSQAAQDPIGFNGRLSRRIEIHALSSHTHRHGVRFTATLLRNRSPVADGVIYDNFSWDDPEYKIFDPPLVMMPGTGIRYAVTHTYNDPPSPNSPALTFGVTSEDEMAILLGYYTTSP
jgi:mono/diheme cytochrome c family protein